MQNDVGEQKQLSKYIETGAMSHMSIYSSHRSLIEIVTTILSDLKSIFKHITSKVESTLPFLALVLHRLRSWIG